MTSSEAEAAELFTERYRIGPTDVTRRIERTGARRPPVQG